MNWEKLITNAKKAKNNVEKNKKLGISSRYAYYFAKGIITPKKEIKQINIAYPSNSYGTTINRKIYKTTYIDMAKRLVNFVEKNKKLPNYVSFQSENGNTYKCSVGAYTYFFATILVYYNEKGKYPQPQRLNTKNLFVQEKKYGHATKQGCDNMGQNNGYYCGVHSLQEVIRNLYGIVVPQSTLASWAGTTTSGTGHSGLDTAVAKFNNKYGKNLKVAWKDFSEVGWNGIKEICNSKNQDCIIHNLYRNQWGHYETVNSVGEYVNVQNSLGSYCSNGCYCGYIEYRTKNEFRSYINGISQKSVMVLTRS